MLNIDMLSSMTEKLPPTNRSLPIALIRAREGVMPPIRSMLTGTGITEQQWRVLRVLVEYGPQNASTLARRSCLLFPSLTRIVQAMSKKGLVTLSRDDTDRRRQTITIAKAGQKIIDEKSDQGAKIVVDLEAKLGKANYEQLLDLLAMLDPQHTENTRK